MRTLFSPIFPFRSFGLALLTVLLGMPAVLSAQESGPLVDLLVRKGLINDQEAEEIRAELVKEFTAIGSQTVQTYQTMGVFTADQLSQISSTMDQLMHNIGLIFPSAFLMAPFMVGWALVVMTDTVLKRTGHSIVPLNKLSHWQAPTSLNGFLLIIITFVLVVQAAMKAEGLVK